MFSVLSKMINVYIDFMRTVISKTATLLENFFIFFWLLTLTLTVCMSFLGVEITLPIILVNTITSFVVAHLILSS